METRTYFFLRGVVRQSPRPPLGWPRSGINGQALDYGMAPPASVGATVEGVIEALRSLPTISLVIDRADFFDPARGIYVNASSRGRRWERPVAVELIDTTGEGRGFRIAAGIRIRGGASRRRNYPRRGFRLYFREVYGERKLRYRLFGDSGAGEFDDVDLRCAQNYAWSHPYEDRSQHTFLPTSSLETVKQTSGVPRRVAVSITCTSTGSTGGSTRARSTPRPPTPRPTSEAVPRITTSSRSTIR